MSKDSEPDITDYSVTVEDFVIPMNMPASGITINLGPIETHQPPQQPDLFRHYVTSQWLHSSHLADENPQWQCESWIKSKPHLAEAWYQQCLEIKHVDEDTVEYYFMGSPQEHMAWRLRWSEMFDDDA